jgi:phosphoenolpyruvate synthase/pyruvate phosphate dikinase
MRGDPPGRNRDNFIIRLPKDDIRLAARVFDDADLSSEALSEGGGHGSSLKQFIVSIGTRVIERMRELGLQRGKNDLDIYVMCEIHNDVLLIDEFSRLFAGFSIGSNNLTQLTLGVDRESALVAFDFDERDPGVKQIIRLAVDGP